MVYKEFWKCKNCRRTTIFRLISRSESWLIFVEPAGDEE